MDSNQPWQEIGGLRYAFASDLVPRSPSELDPADHSPLANAIRDVWPNSHSTYWAMIAMRYRDLYEDLPLEDAVMAVRAGYSSPPAAMRAGIIKRRPYIGFRKDRP